jgi:Holliday junction DNA helicase RuvA
MISSIKGILEAVGKNEITVDVNGIGYSIFVTKSVLNSLPEITGEIKIKTYLDVKETSMNLYGFSDLKEKELFKLLLTVSGISCKSAHNILSHSGFAEIIGLITGKGFSGIKIPGIGSKKIEMISMSLKDKIFKLSSDDFALSPDNIPASYSTDEQSRLEALNALMTLGYARSEAEKLIREVIKLNPEEKLNTENLIKKSLELIS